MTPEKLTAAILIISAIVITILLINREKNKSSREHYDEALHERNMERASKFLIKGAAEGDLYLIEELAECYSYAPLGKPFGIFEDPAKAFELYLQAAKRGSVKSMLKVASAYAAGDGVQENEQEAIKWIKCAADHGDSNSQCELAKWYRKNNDYAKAISYYRRAVQTRDIDAFRRAAVGVGDICAESSSPYYNPKKAAYSYIVAYSASFKSEYADHGFYLRRLATVEINCRISDNERRRWMNDGENLRYNFNI